jgi:hypothetical protein
MLRTEWTRWFSEVGIEDVPLVGGKNASLGEMTRELAPLGIRVPDGYAVTAEAYRHFLQSNGLVDRIRDTMEPRFALRDRYILEQATLVGDCVRDSLRGSPDLLAPLAGNLPHEPSWVARTSHPCGISLPGVGHR